MSILFFIAGKRIIRQNDVLPSCDAKSEYAPDAKHEEAIHNKSPMVPEFSIIWSKQYASNSVSDG